MGSTIEFVVVLLCPNAPVLNYSAKPLPVVPFVAPIMPPPPRESIGGRKLLVPVVIPLALSVVEARVLLCGG